MISIALKGSTCTDCISIIVHTSKLSDTARAPLEVSPETLVAARIFTIPRQAASGRRCCTGTVHANALYALCCWPPRSYLSSPTRARSNFWRGVAELVSACRLRLDSKQRQVLALIHDLPFGHGLFGVDGLVNDAALLLVAYDNCTNHQSRVSFVHPPSCELLRSLSMALSVLATTSLGR